MTNLLIVGSDIDTDQYVADFISKNEIKQTEITRFINTIKIDEAREIKNSLSYRSSAKRVFIVSAGMTIEAQNSLLKAIEESDDNTFFLFCAVRESEYLPTIASRCKRITLKDEKYNIEIENFLKKVDSFSFSEVDNLSSLCGKDIEQILPVLRNLLLSDATPSNKKRAYHTFCKKLISMHSIVKNNNVNEKVVLEYVFSN